MCVFEGCFGKVLVLAWCFCGEVVVECVVNVVRRRRALGAEKHATVFNFIFLPSQRREAGVAVRHEDAEPGRQADSVVEWDVLGAVSERWRGRRESQAKSEWELVSEWKPFAAVLDPGASWKPDVAE
jgi:hypothetical protein